MTGKELIQRVRFAVKDNNRAVFSDWQMLVALNEALDIMYQELATFSNTVFVKTENIMLVCGHGLLPDDFLAVHEVYCGAELLHHVNKSEVPCDNEYFIDGDEIYANKGYVTLEYKPCSPELTLEDLEDDLEVPPYLNNILKTYTVKALKGEDLEGMGKQLKATLAGRGFNRLEQRNVWSARV